MNPPQPFKYRDLYKILELYPEASQARIEQAYRQLARQYYPKREQSKHHKFVELHRAYYILSDTQRRRCYDESLSLNVVENPEITEDKEITLYKREKFDRLNQQLVEWELEGAEDACELLSQSREELLRKWEHRDRFAWIRAVHKVVRGVSLVVVGILFFITLIFFAFVAMSVF